MNRENYDTALLKDSCQKIGVTLTDTQVDQFLIYYEYLVEKNKVMNLTGITEYEEVVLKHFVDSLSIAQVLDLNKYESIMDMGTGAGFPGLPLKIAFPHLKVVLMDSLNKRIQFLNEVIEQTKCENITAIHSRAEDAARQKEYREKFDLCVSRAVANLSTLSEYCIPFVKKGGMFVAYKTMDIEEEVKNAKSAAFLLGGKIKEKREFYLPDSDIGRSFVMIQKEKETAKKYPRKAGIPVKEPL